MKKIQLLLLLSLVSLSTILGQNVLPDYQDGVLIFQLNEKNYDKLKSIDGIVNIEDNAELRNIDRTIALQEVKALYPYHKDHKLRNTFQVLFSNATAINQLVRLFSANSIIEYAEPKELHHTTLTPNDTYFTNATNNGQWALFQINAPQAWDIGTGSASTIVAVTDNAININHPDLTNKMVAGHDAVDNDSDPSPCGSNDGFHGSHVSGIVGAESNNNLGVASIGYDVSIMPVKIGNCNGSLTGGYEGIIWAADNGAHVINMSWGGSGQSQYGQNVCDYAWNAGSILVAAAGNDGVNAVFYPAGYNNVVSVASSTTGDNKSGFSNYGTWIDITAPGSSILSTNEGTGYQVTQGTSMASPMVAGLLGLMHAQAPNATNTDLINCLYSSAVNIDAANPNYVNFLGAGRIEAEQAMICANAYSVALDAAITDIAEPEGNICSGSFTPQVTLRNYGSNTLTSATITYQVSGNPAQTYSWTGSLASTQTAVVTLPTMTLADGSYTFTATSSNPNGSADQNPNNDSFSSNFTTISAGQTVNINITTDCYGSETTWSILDGNNNVVTSGGPYSNVAGGQLETTSVCLATGCYSFKIDDSYGDGMHGSQWQNCSVDGDYNITDGSGNILLSMTAANSDFGNSITDPFCVTSPVGDDAGISSIVNPAGISCSGTVVPNVVLQNFGNQPLTNVDIIYQVSGSASQTFNWTGTLASNQNTTVTLPQVTVGTGSYTFTAYTNLPNGNADVINSNDTSSVNFSIFNSGANLPFVEDFENGFNNQNWTIENPDGAITWELATITGTTPGNNAAKLDFFSYVQLAERDAMITQPLDFTNFSTIDLYFEHAYRRYDQNSTDSLVIYISTDCGATYQRVFARGEDGTGSFATATTTTNAFTPANTNEWCLGTVGSDCFTVNLNSFIGNANVLVKFESYNAGTTGNNLFLDNINISGTPTIACPQVTANSTNVSCNAGSDGSITISSTGGATPVTYSIDAVNYGSNTTFNNLSAGNYYAYAMSSDGCVDSALVVITEPSAVSFSFSETGTTCGQSNGSIIINGAGGTGTYTYSIDNGANFSNNANPTGLAAGSYPVIVQDNNGCASGMSLVTINSSNAITINSNTTDDNCNQGNGSITISATGNGTLTYSIDGGTTTSQNNTFTNLSAGNYNILVTDASGCSNTDVVNIVTSGGNFNLNVNGNNSICAGNSSNISASGVPVGGTYTWDNNLGTGASHSVSPSITTTYTVTGTDVSGCTQTASITVMVNTIPTVTVTSTSDSICAGESVTILANGAQSYNWNTGDMTNSITVNPTNTQSYTVIGQNGNCSSAPASTSIVVKPIPTVIATSDVTTINPGGTVNFNASGSNALTYDWNFGDGTTGSGITTSNVYNVPGTYNVVLTGNLKGCTATDEVLITVNNTSSIDETANVISLFPNPVAINGSIRIEGLGNEAVSGFIYSADGQLVKTIENLNVSQNTISLSGLASGFYFLNIGNSNNEIVRFVIQ